MKYISSKDQKTNSNVFMTSSGNLNDWFDAISMHLRYSARNRMWFSEHILYPSALQIAQLIASKKDSQKTSPLPGAPKEKIISPYYRFVEYFIECPSYEVRFLHTFIYFLLFMLFMFFLVPNL